jgi:hypothetical protein
MPERLQKSLPDASKGHKHRGYKDDKYNDDMSRNDACHNKQGAGNREAWYDSSPADGNRGRDEQGALVQVGAERVDELVTVVVWVVAAADDVAEALAWLVVAADAAMEAMAWLVVAADVVVEVMADVAAVKDAAVVDGFGH